MSANISTLCSARAPLGLGLLALCFAFVIVLAVAFGSTWIPPEDVVRVIVGLGERTQSIIVLNLRLPRVVLAGLAGGAVALAGFLLQRITRNALAAPGVLGVIDGAALGVVLFLMVFSNEANHLIVPISLQPLAAAFGALASITLVFALAGQQASSAMRLLLFGIAVAAMAKAVTIVLMIVGPIYRTSQAARWIAGAVNEASWDQIHLTVLVLAPLVIVALAIARHLPPADLDETSARSVGLNLPPFRILVFALAALLTATAVAFVGGIGFVGLMAPHLARMTLGRNVYVTLVGSFLLGAMMLIGADLAVRVLFAPAEVPAGTVTAIVGAPYFLYLLMQRQKQDG